MKQFLLPSFVAGDNVRLQNLLRPEGLGAIRTRRSHADAGLEMGPDGRESKGGSLFMDQQNTPPSAGGGTAAAPAPAAANSGMADNVAAALGCIPIVGLIFLLIEPYNKNKFVRFYSFQAVAQGVCWFVGNLLLMFIPILGWI